MTPDPADALLSALAREHRSRPPRLASRSARIAVAAGGGLALTALLLVVMALLGLLLP
ncbi:hypothetical protein ACFFKU_11425 [Kineococcus gynurae]|uniref:Uncharacterized protein n=1 Tax=Kineococcus gynurae TaxID=452979 RepID=A0ABV5LUG6_9ACTN